MRGRKQTQHILYEINGAWDSVPSGLLLGRPPPGSLGTRERWLLLVDMAGARQGFPQNIPAHASIALLPGLNKI